MNNPFFENKGPFKIDKLLKLANLNNVNDFKKFFGTKLITSIHSSPSLPMEPRGVGGMGAAY